ARLEPSHLVRIDPVLVLEPGGRQAGEGVVFELATGRVDTLGAGNVDELLGTGHRVEEDRLGRADDSGSGSFAAHAFGDLGTEDGADAEAARSLHYLYERLARLGDRRELVDDEQHVFVPRLTRDRPLRELLDQEAGQIAGFVLQ